MNIAGIHATSAKALAYVPKRDFEIYDVIVEDLKSRPETLQDWFADALYGDTRVRDFGYLDWQTFDPDGFTIRELLVIAMDQGQPSQTRLAAMSEIDNRFINDHMSEISERLDANAEPDPRWW